MDLKEFISETLKQIFDGVTDAQDNVKATGGKISPNVICQNSSNVVTPLMTVPGSKGVTANNIDFDVALTTVEASGTGGKAGLSVWGIGAGVEGKSETTNSTVSRVKFSVSVILPVSK